MTVSVMALFCEDIREEKDGIVSLMGILPDTVNVAQIQSPSDEGAMTRVLSKFCFFARINFDPKDNPPEPSLRLVFPDGQTVDFGKVEAATVQKAITEALTAGTPLAGVISRAVLAGFRAPVGTVKLEVSLGGITHLAGAITFLHATSSTAPLQPS